MFKLISNTRLIDMVYETQIELAQMDPTRPIYKEVEEELAALQKELRTRETLGEIKY